jgi:hypothetical protein
MSRREDRGKLESRTKRASILYRCRSRKAYGNTNRYSRETMSRENESSMLGGDTRRRKRYSFTKYKV